MITAKTIIKTATAEIGYSRWTDPQPGTKYGRDYAKRHGSGYARSGVPYCAMFVTWVFRQLGQTPPGGDFAYCPSGIQVMKRLGLEIQKTKAQPGDIVFFDWGKDGESDHVGFVTGNTGKQLLTVEGNTSANGVSGIVGARRRNFGDVCNVFRPPYDDAPAPASAGGIAVDGIFGPLSIRRLQAVMGTAQDGVISEQPFTNRPFVPGAGDGWQWVTARPQGSTVIRAWQARVGATADGYFGKQSVMASQRFLGVNVDGFAGPITMRAWQSWLNNQ